MKRLVLFFTCAWTAISSFAQTENWNDSVQTYIGQARMLDADAYMKLADCYHKGLGVEHNFTMMMEMLAYADRYADGRRRSLDYIFSLPENDVDLLTWDTGAFLSNGAIGKAKASIERLSVISPQTAKVFQAILAFKENKDTIGFYRLINESVSEGCLPASIVLATRLDADGKIDDAARIMEGIAEHTPMAYNYLGKYYKAKGDMQKSIECYRKADQWACLNSEGAEMLLEEMNRQEEEGLKHNKYEENRLRLIRDGIGG